jgi:hypothetical protein
MPEDVSLAGVNDGDPELLVTRVGDPQQSKPRIGEVAYFRLVQPDGNRHVINVYYINATDRSRLQRHGRWQPW